MNELEKNKDQTEEKNLKFTKVFAGVDEETFRKVSEEERALYTGSCNVKIFMKLEDPETTYELFENSIAKALPSNAIIEENKKL